MSSAVGLVPFTPAAMAAYMATSMQEYAAEHVRAGNWTPEEAPERAQKEFDQLLPQREATPGQLLYSIVRLPDAVPVGMIWMGLRAGAGAPQAFVYDLRIDPEHRRLGFAEAAMRELERIARNRGAQRIGLHVFEHNVGAIRLYERLGYSTTDRLMWKPIPEGRP